MFNKSGDFVDEDGSISKFNPAQHKMNRLNQLGEEINYTEINLLGWHPIHNTWNYNVFLRTTKRIYKESRPKFSDDEKKRCDALLKAIETLLIKYPVQNKLRNSKWSSPNLERFDVFCKYMEEFEDLVNDFKEKHGLDTPNIEDEDGL